ncbi:hypothetical protein MBLNU459_g7635t1 [Dothideomycetes sp. NU459]
MFRRVPRRRWTDSNRGGEWRGRGRSDNPYPSNEARTPRQLQQPRGLFVDGMWLCNCAPRLPAEHFKVKKEGRNQGRWFYTCQNGEGRRCDFFLWDEDAKPRMEAAILSNSRNEPAAMPGVFQNRAKDPPPLTTTAGTSRANAIHLDNRSPTQSPGPSPSYTAGTDSSHTLTSISSGQKRTVGDTDFGSDDNENESDPFPWALTGQEEAEMTRVVDRISHAPETPRKVAKTEAYTTPATTTAKRRLPWLDYSDETPTQIQTPSKHVGLLTPASKTPASRGKDAMAPDTTPTPLRFKDALTESSTSSELIDEVFATFKAASAMPTSDLAVRLKSVLTKHDLRTQGVAKGREISRLALKAKDAKIAELQARVSALEAEREVDRARIRGLRLKDATLD